MDEFKTTHTGMQFGKAVGAQLPFGLVGKPEVDATGSPLCRACARLSADLALVRAV
jgi:hypothetical protein